jgi:hypothetical protein
MTESGVRARMNIVRIESHDCIDESIKIFSNVNASHRLPKHTVDDFSWPKDGIVVIKNLSEQECAVSLTMLACSAEYVVLRSSRGPAKAFYVGIKGTHPLRPGEAWTLRGCDALTPVGALSV